MAGTGFCFSRGEKTIEISTLCADNQLYTIYILCQFFKIYHLAFLLSDPQLYTN